MYLWKQPGTEIITQQNFPAFRAYQERIQGYLNRSSAAQFNFDLQRINTLSSSPTQHVEPTITFDDHYEFELGGVKFEIFHTPGETPDALTVWIPKYQAAFVGDNIYDSFPNMYTLRGTTPRWPLEYIASLNKVLALKPEMVLPSHGLPIQGHDKVVERLTKYRDAIQYVHDATVKGMNDGKDVYTLMREVKLPAELGRRRGLRQGLLERARHLRGLRRLVRSRSGQHVCQPADGRPTPIWCNWPAAPQWWRPRPAT